MCDFDPEKVIGGRDVIDMPFLSIPVITIFGPDFPILVDVKLEYSKASNQSIKRIIYRMRILRGDGLIQYVFLVLIVSFF